MQIWQSNKFMVKYFSSVALNI